MDGDTDGFTNFEEYVAGTDPASRSSAFILEAISTTSGTVLSLQTTSGRTYAVEYTLDLGSTNTWMVLTNDVLGTGSPVSITDTNVAGQRFYRGKVRME